MLIFRTARVLLFALLLTVLFYASTYAGNMALFISHNGEYLRCDMDRLKVVNKGHFNTETFLDTSANTVALDRNNNHLFVSEGSQGGTNINIYNSRTMEFIRSLDSVFSKDVFHDETRIIVNKQKNVVYIKWAEENAGKLEYILTVLSGKKLEKISEHRSIQMFGYLYLSDNGEKLYSIVQEKGVERVEVVSTDTFDKTDTIDLAWINTPNVYGWGVESMHGTKLLISETYNDESKKPTVYYLDIISKETSAKVTIEENGSFFPALTKGLMVLSEEKEVPHLGEFTRNVKLARIHIYSMTTGNKVASITFDVNKAGYPYMLTPNGGKLLYAYSGIIKVIDLNTFEVVKELPIGGHYIHFFHYEE